MTTTDSRTSTAAAVRALSGAAAAGASVTVLAGLLGGRAAGLAALLGAGLAVVGLGFGSLAVDHVARHLPAASLLFALLTYTLQVVLMAAVFVAVGRAGWLGDELDRRWLGGAIITCAVVWAAVQLRVATTARIPVYELGGSRHEGGAG